LPSAVLFAQFPEGTLRARWHEVPTPGVIAQSAAPKEHRLVPIAQI